MFGSLLLAAVSTLLDGLLGPLRQLKICHAFAALPGFGLGPCHQRSPLHAASSKGRTECREFFLPFVFSARAGPPEKPRHRGV